MLEALPTPAPAAAAPPAHAAAAPAAAAAAAAVPAPPAHAAATAAALPAYAVDAAVLTAAYQYSSGQNRAMQRQRGKCSFAIIERSEFGYDEISCSQL